MPLPSAIFPAAVFDGGRVIDNPADLLTDLSSDADTDSIGGAAINRLKAEMTSVQTQLKNEFQIDFNLKEGNAIVFDADRDTYIQADADDQLGFYVGGAEVVVLDASYMGVGVEFEVFQGIYPLIKADANKNVMLGSPAAHITTDTEGFVYLNTVNGTPTGVPATTHGDSKPIVYDKVNDALYVYNAGWQPVGSGTVGGSGTANFVPAWTASNTLGNSAYGDDGTYGTFMALGSSTFNDANTLAKWRGSTVPAAFLASSGNGADLYVRAQDAASGGGGNGANIYFRPGQKDGGGANGKFIIQGATAAGEYRFDDARLTITGTTADIYFSQQGVVFRGLQTSTGIKVMTVNYSGNTDLGMMGRYWLSDSANGTTPDIGIYNSSAGIWSFTNGALTDASSSLKLSVSGTAPSSYTNAADTHGKHAIFRAQSGGTHTAANPNGGDFRFILGAKGSGGSGTAGTFKIYDSGASGYLNLSHNATDGIITTSTGLLRLQAASDIYLQPAGGDVLVLDTGGTKSFALTHDGTDGVLSTSSGDIRLSPVTGLVGINQSSPAFGLDISVAGSAVLGLTGSDAGAVGPAITTYHNSASPANADQIWRLIARANDNGGTARSVGKIAIVWDDTTSTTMDSSMQFATMDNVNAGTFNTTATLTSIGAWTDASAEAFKAWDGHPADFFGKSVVSGLRELKCHVYHSSRHREGSKPIRERHLSPSAEDLWRVFPGLGRDPERLKANGQTPGIAPKDLGGLAICGVVENANEIDALKARVAKLEQEVERLKAA